MKKSHLATGLTVLSTFFLCVSVTTSLIMEAYRDPLDEFTHQRSSKIITDPEAGDGNDWNYEGKFHSAKEAFEGYKEFALKEAEESNVLLKNENNALPLTQAKPKVTLFGLRSYATIYGNSGGSTPDMKTVEEGNRAPETFAKYFDLNPSMQLAYKNYIDTLTWGGSGFGARPPVYREIDDHSGMLIHELSETELAGYNSEYNKDFSTYNDAAIVVVGRGGGESFNYDTQKVDAGNPTTTGNIMGLSAEEKEIIELAKTCSQKVIVLINATNTMEFKELALDEDIDAIMWIGHPGPYGLNKVCETLLGKVNPSGHLGDTLATNGAVAAATQSIANVPWVTTENQFESGANVNSYLIEGEGIYSGYRYYETRYNDVVYGTGNASTAKAGTYTAPDYTVATTDGSWNYSHEVTYPFGYGLSYTTFEQTLESVNILGNKKEATVTVNVKNTGSVAGKDVIQLYAQTPYTEYDKVNKVEKSAIQLVDFEKTPLLNPGQTVSVTMKVDMANIASYDYTKAKTFIVDAGDYYFSLGNGAHDALNNVLAAQGKTTSNGMDYNGDASKTYKWNWSGDVDAATFSVSDNGTEITNRLSDGDYSMDINSFEGFGNTVEYLTRKDWNGTFPTAHEGLRPTGRLATLLGNDFIQLKEGDTSAYKWGVDNGLKLQDLKGAEWKDDRWDDLVDQVTVAEFLDFASHAFHHIQEIPSVGYAGNDADDGPGGSDSHTFGEGTYHGEAWEDRDQYAGFGTRVAPSQENLAYTWNKELAYENGEIIIGETSLIFNLPIMIGPGMNIHRHGYNGRGGEYYSEDPILSGYIGSASVQGAQSKGCLVNIKHAAFNDQEVNRSGIAVFMNEQKARELELRNLQQAFEAKGKPASFENDETKANTYTMGALGVMTSYNRIGATASSANRGLMVDIMRNEWGFKGYNVTDFTGVSLKAAPKESILAGTTAFCGFGTANLPYWNSTGETLSKDPDVCAAIKQNIKYILFSLANSNALNGVNSSTRRIELMTTWRAAYISLITIFTTTTAAALAFYVVSLILERKEK